MNIFEVYLLTLIPNLADSLGIIFTLSLILAVVGTVIGTVEKHAEALHIGKKAASVACVALFLSVFVPNTTQLYTMIGAYAATNVEGIESLPEGLVGAANTFLENVAQEELGKLTEEK